MLKLVKKNKKWLEMSPVVWSVVILLSVLMLWTGLWSSYNAYLDFLTNNQKLELEQTIDKMSLNTIAWEWIMTDVRIKRNIYLLKNGSPNIDVYSYREVFKINPWTNQVLSTPTIEFDRYYKIPLSDDGETKIIFLPESQPDIDKLTKVWIQIDSPNNTIISFAADNNFTEMTTAALNLVGSNDNRIKMQQAKQKARNFPNDFYRWDYINEVQYWRVINGCAPPWCVEYSKLKVGIMYKRSIIWYINIDKDANKLKFTRTDIILPKKYNLFNHCTYWADSVCHENYEYSSVLSCTYAFWYCYTNWTVWKKPWTEEPCTWNSWVCN